MSLCTKTIPAWVGPRGTQWAASLRMLDRLPESLAGTLVLSSLLFTVHLLQSLKKKNKNHFLSLLWPGRIHSQGLLEGQQRGQQVWTLRTRTFMLGIQRFLHRPLKKLSPVNTEGSMCSNTRQAPPRESPWAKPGSSWWEASTQQVRGGGGGGGGRGEERQGTWNEHTS